jgi:hypothetical protein
MNVGDLVQDICWLGERLGIILEKVRDPLAMNNQVFKVLWRDGTIGNSVWDYDLEKVQ